MNTSITDIPRQGTGVDEFSVSAYEQGLISFIKNAQTPITIALQGEWGSGKTSLMNVLNESLGKTDFHTVWINTWEYSLMTDSQELLIQILSRLVSATTDYGTSDEQNALLKNGKEILGKVLKATAKAAVGTTCINPAIIDELCEQKESSVSELSNHLKKSISSTLSATKRKGFIFFVDDLDRIDPPVAVKILELLKNVFTLDNCIFVLAIDYDVVIKGLKPKFGELTSANEREFRSFFDKIIQVPFSMPVGKYNVDSFLLKKLVEVGVLTEEDCKDSAFVNQIVEAEQLTIGRNPRSIKRFLNTLSLIKCIGDASVVNTPEQKSVADRQLAIYMNIALVGLQVAYPNFYNLLASQPDFTSWDESVLLKMGLSGLTETEQERLKAMNTEFDEPWEQILYVICQQDHFLKRNCLSISTLFNSIRDRVVITYGLKAKDETEVKEAINDCIERELTFTTVTGVGMASSNSVSRTNTKEYRRELKEVLFCAIKNNTNCVESMIGEGFRKDKIGLAFNGGAFEIYTNDVIQETLQVFLKSEYQDIANASKKEFCCGVMKHGEAHKLCFNVAKLTQSMEPERYVLSRLIPFLLKQFEGRC